MSERSDRSCVNGIGHRRRRTRGAGGDAEQAPLIEGPRLGCVRRGRFGIDGPLVCALRGGSLPARESRPFEPGRFFGTQKLFCRDLGRTLKRRDCAVRPEPFQVRGPSGVRGTPAELCPTSSRQDSRIPRTQSAEPGDRFPEVHGRALSNRGYHRAPGTSAQLVANRIGGIDAMHDASGARSGSFQNCIRIAR